MKSTIAIVILLTASAFTANAQCDPEPIAALYGKFLNDHKGTPEQRRMASETAREYISKFGACEGDAEKKVTAYIKEWQVKYEVGRDESNCTTAVDKTPARAFELCKPHLARDPDNLRTNLLLSLAGIKQTSDKASHDQTLRSIRKSLELIKAGKTLDRWVFGGSKEETVATLEFYSAYLTIDATPSDTATMMLSLARSNTSYSKNPNTFFYLARTLHDTETKKYGAEYGQKCPAANASTPECDALWKNLEASINRVIDAYARAVALGEGKPEHAAVVASSRSVLTDLYKNVHDSDAGLNEYIAGVLSKPIP